MENDYILNNFIPPLRIYEIKRQVIHNLFCVKKNKTY